MAATEKIESDHPGSITERRETLTKIRRAFVDHPEVGRLLSQFKNPSAKKDLQLTGDPLKDYLGMAQDFRLLTKNDEINLFKKLSRGINILLADKDAIDMSEHRKELVDCAAAYEVLVHCNIRLIISIVKKRYKAFEDIQTDLFQQGIIGITTAISNYDYRRNQKLSTYASWWVAQDINRYIANTVRAIRLPVHKHEDWLVMNRTERKMAIRLGREVTVEELASESDMSVDQVVMLKKAGQINIHSLNKTLGDEKETEFGDLITDSKSEHEIDDAIEELLMQRAMNDIFVSGGLNLQQAQVLSLKYGIYRPELSGTTMAGENVTPRTYDECFLDTIELGRLTINQIAEELGLTYKIVRTTEENALHQLRRFVPELASVVAG